MQLKSVEVALTDALGESDRWRAQATEANDELRAQRAEVACAHNAQRARAANDGLRRRRRSGARARGAA